MPDVTATMTRRELEAKAAEHDIDVSACRTKDEVHQTIVRELADKLRDLDGGPLPPLAAVFHTPPEPQALELADALPRILGDLKPIPKNGTAPGSMGSYKFRRQEDIAAALKPLFAKYGIAVVPRIVERRSSERGTKPMYCEDLLIRFETPHGELLGEVWGQGTDAGDKAVQKAVTSAFKTLLTVVFLISDSADDAEAHEYDAGAPAPEIADATPLGRVADIIERLDALHGYPQAWRDAKLPKRAELQACLDTPDGIYLPLSLAGQCEAVLDGAEAARDTGVDPITGEKLTPTEPEATDEPDEDEPEPEPRMSREESVADLKAALARTDAATGGPCPTCGGVKGEHAADCSERPF